MSTTKPRITVTLEPRTYEVLSRLSAAGGDSMSALVSQVVEVAVPSLERVVAILERAKTAPKEALAGLSAAIDRAEQQLLPALMEAQGQTDLFVADALRSVSPAVVPPAVAAKRTRRGVPAPASDRDPRLVTRGSGGPIGGRKGVKRG